MQEYSRHFTLPSSHRVFEVGSVAGEPTIKRAELKMQKPNPSCQNPGSKSGQHGLIAEACQADETRTHRIGDFCGSKVLEDTQC